MIGRLRLFGVHPARLQRLRAIQVLDPSQDAHAIYRTTALLTFPWEMRLGLNLAFYRPFAAPRIAALLAHTGELERHPDKRALDTGLFIYELIEHGFDHERGRSVVTALNRMHRRWPIVNEDYVYVLAAFVAVPVRFIDAHGWRPLTPQERQAAACFYGELGRRMNVADVPRTYEAFAAFLDHYERRHLVPSAAGHRLVTATQRVLADGLPAPLRPFADRLSAALLDARLCRCLGMRPAGTVTRAALHAALALRAAVVRRSAPRSTGWFVPGHHGSRVYPHGYALPDLGAAASGRDLPR